MQKLRLILFRAVFQENKKALEGLLYALLALPEGSIAAIDIENPIELGKVINDKTCILDLKIMLNDKQLLNIEMQVTDYGNWPERSLTYLCRAFDHLKGGEDYKNSLYHWAKLFKATTWEEIKMLADLTFLLL